MNAGKSLSPLDGSAVPNEAQQEGVIFPVDGLTGSYSGPEVGFEEIAIESLRAHFVDSYIKR